MVNAVNSTTIDQAEIKKDKKNILSEKIKRFNELDPRRGSQYLVDRSINLMNKMFDIADGSESIDDMRKSIATFINFKKNVSHDPQYLIESISQMSENDKSILMSLLKKDNLLVNFKQRELNPKDLIG